MTVSKIFYLLIFEIIATVAMFQKEDCILIEGLNDKYDLSNPVIVFKIINTCDTKFEFYIHYQEFIDDSWVSVWDDIGRNYYSKTNRVFILPEKDTLTLKWDAGNYPKISPEGDKRIKPDMYKGIYRFAFYIPKKKQKKEDIIFSSKQFTVY